VIQGPHIDWLALAGVNSLLAASALALLSAVLVPGPLRRPVAASLCALGYATAIGFSIALYVKSPHGHGVVVDAFRRDRLAQFAGIILAGSGLLATAVSYRERMREHHGEYYALLAAAGGGMLFFVGANNLMTLFLGLEWFSICLYILCAIDRDRLGGLEAALKYLVIGGFGSAVLLFGSALVYGATGQLNFDAISAAGQAHDSLLVFGLAMIIAGLAFKASAAPFHMWTPDVYEGAPTPVTAFMAAATKAAAHTSGRSRWRRSQSVHS
jgi:NADH-quinone oxidoreductase subunit N